MKTVTQIATPIAVPIKTQFYNYCLEYGFSKSNCEQLTPDIVYQELYECWISRTKQKKYTYEAYLFEQNAGIELYRIAAEICTMQWRPSGYKSFQVHHPDRTICAPYYIDRIVEYWFTDKYIAPYWKGKLLENNIACQKGKGPYDTIEKIKEAFMLLFQKYGIRFGFFKGDMQGYFDNISHEYVKELYKGINPYAYFLFCNTIDSWQQPNCYAKEKNPNGIYGVPKGNLPSQWVGVTVLNELDHIISSMDGCLFYTRYVDDFLCFFRTIEECRRCKDMVKKYLEEKKLGVRLHPRKTAYAPITRGFDFCGWLYKFAEDGTIEVKVRQDRKRLKKRELKSKQKANRKGKLSRKKAQDSLNSTCAHYKHGDTKNLQKYMCNHYVFK